MLRSFATLLALSFSVSALAEVKTPGTIVANSCSRKIVAASPEKMVLPKVICDASLVGSSDSFVLIDDEVWVVTKTQSRGSDLLQEIRFIGTNVFGRLKLNSSRILTQGQVIRQAQGPVLRMGVLTGSIKVWATGFEMMFHTL